MTAFPHRGNGATGPHRAHECFELQNRYRSGSVVVYTGSLPSAQSKASQLGAVDFGQIGA
jgi:hypothetical protein